MLMLDRVRECADEFDILHFHIDQFHFPLFRPIAERTVTTLHGRQDLPDLKPLYVGFRDMPLVSISDAQRKPMPNANFVATVHHGIPSQLLKPTYRPRGGYVAFLGRISPEKRPDRAIALPAHAGIRLKIAAKVDKVDEAYFREQIAPLLGTGRGVHRRDRRACEERISRAGARAAVPDRLAGAVRIVHDRGHGLRHPGAGVPLRLGARDHRRRRHRPDRRQRGGGDRKRCPQVIALDRRRGPAAFEERFSASRMAKDYVQVYRSLLQ